ncbi:MAG: alpha/beta hydrolase fold domain-containing protein [Mycobacteriales bacterium]
MRWRPASPGQLVVSGASAGGTLAAALGLLARDRGVRGIAGFVLFYPMLDDRPGRPEMERATMTRTWNRGANRLAWQAYLGERTEVPFYAAPSRATVSQLRGLPPVYLDVGGLDPFLGENLDFARDLSLADVPVELVFTPGAFHASELLAPQAPTSRRIAAARYHAREHFLRGLAG